MPSRSDPVQNEAWSSSRLAAGAVRRLATAALNILTSAAAQVEHAVNDAGFRGVGVAGSVARESAAPNSIRSGHVRSVWGARLPDPLGTRLGTSAGWPEWVLTNTRQPARTRCLVASDLRRDARPLPGLKICAAHGGGFLPSYANRRTA